MFLLGRSPFGGFGFAVERGDDGAAILGLHLPAICWRDHPVCHGRTCSLSVVLPSGQSQDTTGQSGWQTDGRIWYTEHGA